MQDPWTRGVLALLAAFAIAFAGFVAGHLADEATLKQIDRCEVGIDEGCVIDQQVRPSLLGSVKSKLGLANLRGALVAPKAFAAGDNGRLGDAELSPATGGVGGFPGAGQLATNAAAAWNTAAVAIHAKTGQWLASNGSDSMYRPIDRQVYWRNYWCGRGACQNAAIPGTSNHGWGWAVDTPAGTQALLRTYGAPYGWSFACSDAPWEAWHVKWCGGVSFHDPGPYGKAAPAGFQTLHPGSHGRRVCVLSRQLATLRRDHVTDPHRPHYIRAQNQTCHFRKHGTVRRGVRRFQRDEQLHDDGIFGPKTHRHMHRRWRHYQATH